MSLWSKPTPELTFNDVDEYLGVRLPESTRLDYKLDIPSDVEKAIAAFANTLAAAAISGVEEDRQHNTPIWPRRCRTSSPPRPQRADYSKSNGSNLSSGPRGNQPSDR